jgi:chromosome segregation ATPase
MARAGIGYEQVSVAAFGLARSEQPVTVDNVRAQLGGTGSKSTIAPLLRRWKAENAAKNASQAPLPQGVLQSVRRLYEDIEQQFKTERAVTDLSVSLREAEFMTQNELLRENLGASERTRSELDDAFADAKLQLTALRQELATADAELQKYKIQQESLEQRLEERASEVANLRNQVTQITRQLDHFQSASQRRWEEERRIHESKLTEALHANERMREELQHVRQHSLTVQAELASSMSGHEQLSAEHRRLQAAFDELRQQTTRQEESIRRCDLDAAQRLGELATLKRSYELAATKLAEAETHLAVSSSKEAMLEATLLASERRAEAAQNEYAAQLRKCAELDAELRYCQRMLKSRT